MKPFWQNRRRPAGSPGERFSDQAGSDEFSEMNKQSNQRILDAVREFSTPERPVYLVGGAVRDLLLNRSSHDLDFVLPGKTRPLAHEISCRLNGALYVMDEERDTTRVILGKTHPASLNEGDRLMIDFASLRSNDLEGDLRARDFTINAMAFDVSVPNRLIDPTGGLADLREKRIRPCSPTSLTDDPVRVIRAVRQALAYGFRIDPETIQQMRAAAPLLQRVSPERVRDELFRIFGGAQVHLAVRILDQVGALRFILPELEVLKGVSQPAPHIYNVWEHTVRVVQYLEQLYAPLVGDYNQETVPDLTVGSAVLWLGRYREKLEEHFNRTLVPDRALRGLLFFAALYHDVAKPETRTETTEARVQFLNHQAAGARKAALRARALALSSAEVQRLETIIDHHMRIHQLAGARDENGEWKKPSRRAIYRFFKDTRDVGIDICLLTLADIRGTYGVTLPQDIWERELEVCRTLMEAYWENNAKIVSPPRLLTGDDLMEMFDLRPGRDVGRLLAAIREAQAAGEIQDRESAVEFARQWLKRA